MELTKHVQLWAGLGFSAILVFFFIAAFFRREKWHHGQWIVVRILGSLCAAFAAALFTGNALVDYEQVIGAGGKFSFQGAAGFALFFLVWYTFPKPAFEPPPPDGNISLPSGLTFQAAIKLLADKGLEHSRGANFSGFSADELSAPLLSDAVINLRDGQAALLRVRDFTGPTVGPYNVSLKDDRYQVEKDL